MLVNNSKGKNIVEAEDNNTELEKDGMVMRIEKTRTDTQSLIKEHRRIGIRGKHM